VITDHIKRQWTPCFSHSFIFACARLAHLFLFLSFHSFSIHFMCQMCLFLKRKKIKKINKRCFVIYIDKELEWKLHEWIHWCNCDLMQHTLIQQMRKKNKKQNAVRIEFKIFHVYLHVQLLTNLILTFNKFLAF
jgi:hypothetical protein